MTAERYFFCHIPKTAGTSTRLALARQFGEEAIYPQPDDEQRLAGFDIDLLRTEFERRGDEIRVIVGHYPLWVVDLLGEQFRCFTLLRDPVARTLSHLRYQRLIDDNYAGKSLEEAYATPANLFGVIHNMMVKMLGTEPGELKDVAQWVTCTDEHLERAKRALENMDVVGVQTQYGSFLADLEKTFGWDMGEEVRANTTNYEPVDPEFTQRIARDSPLDMALYHFARDLVASRAADEALERS